jgi:hypothetical protein
MKNIVFLLLFWLKIVHVFGQNENKLFPAVPTITKSNHNLNTSKELLSASSKPTKLTIATFFPADILTRGVGLYNGSNPSDQLSHALAKTVAFSVCEVMGLISSNCVFTGNSYGFVVIVGPIIQQITLVSANVIDYPQYNGDVDTFRSTLIANLFNSFTSGDYYDILVRNAVLYNFKPSFTNDSLLNCAANSEFAMPPTFQPTSSPVGLWNADPSDDASISKAEVAGLVIAVLIVFVFLLIGIYFLLKDLKKDSQSITSTKSVQLTSIQKKSVGGAKYSSVVVRAPTDTAGTYIV